MTKYYPKRTGQDLERKLFKKLPQKLRRIYTQSISACNEELDLLCAIGLRALIEGICADKGVTGRDLEKRIDALGTLHLPPNIVENLHSFRFMGNEAVHELNPPSRKDLRLAIEISEDLLNFLYELDYKARAWRFQGKQHLLRNPRNRSKAEEFLPGLEITLGYKPFRD